MKKLIKDQYFLIAIAILAIFLRIAGQNPGFPDNHPDEIVAYGSGVHMLYNFFKPDYFYYPAGVPFLSFIAYWLFLPFIMLKIFISQPELLLSALHNGLSFFTVNMYEIFGQRFMYAMYWSRYVTAIFSASTVLLVYYFSSRVFNKRTGLFAAFILAINYRHVVGAYISLPDPYNGFFSLLSLLACFLLLEKNTLKRYFMVGISLGFVLSMKYQIFSYVPFLLVHLFWAIKHKKFSYLFYWPFFASLLLSFATFLAINPYLIFNLKDFFYNADLTYRWYQMGKMFLRSYPFFYLYHFGIGELVSVAIIGGAISMLFKQFKKTILLLSFILPFFYVFTYYSNGGLYTRNFITVIPLLVIFAGYFFDQIYLLLKKILKHKIAVATIIVIVILTNFNSLRNSFLFEYYYSKPWNSDILVQWAKEKIPKNIKIRTYNLLLSSSNSSSFANVIKEKNIEQLTWDYSKGPNSLSEFQDDGTDFAILNTQPLQSVTYWWRQFPASWMFRYDDVPFDYISNGYYGLTVQELKKYLVHEIYKPWQSPAENNYLIFKIPPKQKELGKKIKIFTFDDKSAMWQLRGKFNLQPRKFSWISSSGDERRGMLLINGEEEANTSRVSSAPIEIKPGNRYAIKGWMKNIQKGKEKIFTDRDGFLRIDFYKSIENFDNQGVSIAVSSRPFIDNKWMQVSASAQAPKDAKYMTISFQRNVQSLTLDTYLDEVDVYESDSLQQEPFNKLPYIMPAIPLESIYYNTFL